MEIIVTTLEIIGGGRAYAVIGSACGDPKKHGCVRRVCSGAFYCSGRRRHSAIRIPGETPPAMFTNPIYAIAGLAHMSFSF